MSGTDQTTPAGATTVVHLVRHGEVDNPARVLYGRIPGYRLSPAGQEMAAAAAAFLAGRDVTLIRSSPLERARETAAPIAAEFGLPVGVDERLIEPWNHFEGMRFGVGDGALRRPRHWVHLRNPFLPSWGEPYREIAGRMMAAVTDAAAAARGHEAVCVSHQLAIWIARKAVEQSRLWHDPRRRQCALGSVTSLTFTGDKVTSVRYTTPAGHGRRQVAGA